MDTNKILKKMMNKTSTNKICIYHGNCADGFYAALVVKLALGDKIQFHTGIHGDEPPNVSGKDVILVDFSYKRDVILEMSNKAKSILILDHHKTAEDQLVNLPENVNVIFDMNKSGCVIAWNHYFPNKEIPKLLLHIQDRDLWTFKLKGTREILSNVSSYPYDFDIWEKLLFSNLNDLYKEGESIDRKHLKDINEFIKQGSYIGNIDGHIVPILNAPSTWSSDACHIMGKNQPFAVCYYDDAEFRNVSLRSDDNGIDVSEIAVKFGGGGHEHASGFKIPIKLKDKVFN